MRIEQIKEQLNEVNPIIKTALDTLVRSGQIMNLESAAELHRCWEVLNSLHVVLFDKAESLTSHIERLENHIEEITLETLHPEIKNSK